MTTLAKYKIRTIQASDDEQVGILIRSVGKEFGAVGQGFGPSDSEVEAMSLHYAEPKHLFLVITLPSGGPDSDETVVGCGGIAPLDPEKGICELKKLFLHPDHRGSGLGKALTQKCLTFANAVGYQHCYLDTLSSMKRAISIYEKFGFEHLDAPIDLSVHSGCDVWMIKALGNS